MTVSLALRLVAPVWHATPDMWWSSSRVDRRFAISDPLV
jgi:hypothetical protein